MEIFGIGLPEILFVLLISVIVLGPRDLTQAARTIGKFLRSVVTSEWWQSFKSGVQEVRKLPYQLMREAGMEEDWQAVSEVAELGKRKNIRPDKPGLEPGSRRLQAWTEIPPGAPLPDLDRGLAENHTILPPAAKPDSPEKETQNPGPAAENDLRDPSQPDRAG